VCAQQQDAVTLLYCKGVRMRNTNTKVPPTLLPSLLFREVQQSINGANMLYNRWKELLQTANTAQDEEFLWTNKELQEVIKNIEWDLQDLEETIHILAPLSHRASVQ
jgi:hypothetical protein